MSKITKVLAFDFGASSGRAMLCTFDGERLQLDEMHRFSNDPVMIGKSLHWDILRLFFEIKQGILKCINAGHTDIAAIGIDTWGVDYGLLDKEGKLIQNPYHYRDVRTNGMMELCEQMVGTEYIFNTTGIQFNFFNTLFQMLSSVKSEESVLSIAKNLLFTPDLLNYFLTGSMKSEYTIASTSQLLDASSSSWAYEMMSKLGINQSLFGEIVQPGTIIGTITSDLQEELGCGPIPVVAVGSHDTASAVASVPVTEKKDFIYISSGTWSLMGIEADAPIINKKTYNYNFTNEGGVGGKIRFLKNIMGLWITQESRRQWQREGKSFSFDNLENAAWAAEAFVSLIDPDSASFAPPGNMPRRIRKFCEESGQRVPLSEGEVIRCIAQSIAFKCRMTVDALKDVCGKDFEAIHMLGGGIKDTMVCQFTANATGMKVVAGPVEATATGNALVQLMALGEIDCLTQARGIVKNSAPIKEYIPQDCALWEAGYQKFKTIAKMS